MFADPYCHPDFAKEGLSIGGLIYYRLYGMIYIYIMYIYTYIYTQNYILFYNLIWCLYTCIYTHTVNVVSLLLTGAWQRAVLLLISQRRGRNLSSEPLGVLSREKMNLRLQFLVHVAGVCPKPLRTLNPVNPKPRSKPNAFKGHRCWVYRSPLGGKPGKTT